MEEKTLWFTALPISERMEIFCSFTYLALELNPDLAGKKNAQSVKGRVRVLSKTDAVPIFGLNRLSKKQSTNDSEIK